MASALPHPARAISSPAASCTAPRTNAKQGGLSSLQRALVLWHLTSLDAPSVATLWTALLGRCFGVPASTRELIAMFAAVWILYAADRLLDARHSVGLEPRHLFHRKHRRGFERGLGVAAAVLALCVTAFDRSTVRSLAVLGTLLFAWFLLVHTGRRPRMLPKELVVAAFFAAATAIPALSGASAARLPLFASAALFASIVGLNGFCIHLWENTSRGERQRIRRERRMLRRSAAGICAASVICAGVLLEFRHTAFAQPSLAVAVSAILLMLADRYRPQNRTVLRSLADAALLTPLPFLISGAHIR